jgi:hypothetical protein
MKRGIVMRATSDLHDDENGKRFITTNMKVWKDLTPKDKSSLKKSIMVALDHNFKGGSINDIPKDLHKIIDKINDHIKEMNGHGLFDKPINLATDAINTLKKTHSNVSSLNAQIKARTEARKAKLQGQGFGTNYLKPKGTRQMIFFDSDSDSDTSSSDDDRLYLHIKRGRGRPRKCQ